MDFNTNADAYWISPSGKISEVKITHIADVIHHPEYFGYTREEIMKLYKDAGEKVGEEGVVRDQIIRDLFKKGWIRIRRYFKQYTFSIQAERMTKRIKDYLYRFAMEMLKNDKVKNYDVRITTNDGYNKVTDLGDISRDVLFNEDHKLVVVHLDTLTEEEKKAMYLENRLDEGLADINQHYLK